VGSGAVSRELVSAASDVTLQREKPPRATERMDGDQASTRPILEVGAEELEVVKGYRVCAATPGTLEGDRQNLLLYRKLGRQACSALPVRLASAGV
jgi:hypothetical protein